MRALAALGSLLRPPGRPQADVAEAIRAELEHHLACAAGELERAGRTREEARTEALARFGDLERVQRSCFWIQTGEGIMLQRLHLAVTIVLFLALLFLGWMSFASRRSAAIARELAVASRVEAEARLQAALEAEREARLPVEHIVIQVGDVLELIDAQNQLRMKEKVMADGKVLVSDAGWIHVAGLTREQTEAAITAALRPYFVEADVKVKVNP